MPERGSQNAASNQSCSMPFLQVDNGLFLPRLGVKNGKG